MKALQFFLFFTHCSGIRIGLAPAAQLDSSTADAFQVEEKENSRRSRGDLSDMFECAFEEGVPIFARNGFLLGAIRDKRDLDGDYDVGYLQEDEEVVHRFMKGKSPCLQKKKKKIHMGITHTINKCSGAPCSVAGLCEDPRKINWGARCSKRSENIIFGASIGGTVLSMAAFLPRAHINQTITDGSYMYNINCLSHRNCPMEAKLFYGKYGHSHHREPQFHYKKEWLKPLKKQAYYDRYVLVPANPEEILKEMYGSEWMPFNKHR